MMNNTFFFRLLREGITKLREGKFTNGFPGKRKRLRPEYQCPFKYLMLDIRANLYLSSHPFEVSPGLFHPQDRVAF
jgi:hypothetical protein